MQSKDPLVPQTFPTPKGDLTIRTTAAADGAALRELRLESLKNFPANYGTSYEDTVLHTVASWEERAAKSTGDGVEAIHIAVDTTGHLVGMTGIWCATSPKEKHASMIWGVYVRPAWQGLHVAEALVTASVNWAAKRGQSFVKLTVNSQNAPAIRCYQRCGFETYGLDPSSIRHNGIDYDELLMIRRL
jgi:ribosomal protein S18 acetylase RimI-like enzyme